MSSTSETLPARMRAWRFHRFGSVRDLQMDAVDVPVPGPQDCLVKIEYAALNPADRLLVMGRYPTGGKPPFSVGRDGCGTVVAARPAGGRFATGARVVCLRSIIGIERDGTLADYVSVPEAHLAPLPAGWTAADGAAGTHVLLTAWQALFDVAHLAAGETVVVSGASGGIGIAALLIARALGARTIALSRSAIKRERLLAVGADSAFDIGDEDLVARVHAAGGGDVIVDSVGGSFLPRALAMANRYGRVCVIGALGGTSSVIDPTQLIFKRLQIHGIQVALYSDAESQLAWSRLAERVIARGGRVPIDRIFAFTEVPAAFEHLRAGPFGKIVVGPMGDAK